MWKLALPGIMTLVPGLLASQKPDTITLVVGHPSVDGRIYKAHWSEARRSVMKDGQVVRSLTYWNHTYTTNRDGVPVCVVESQPMPGGPDPEFYEITVLDARTTALRHIEQRDGSGKWLVADIDGAHVTGRFRASRDAVEERLDFTLETPSYFVPFVDAAIGATPIRDGQVWRVPTFSFAPTARKTDWHTFHIVGRETVPAKEGTNNAWVIEDDALVRTKIWITYEPPYLPQVLRYLSDGSVARFASRVIEAPSGLGVAKPGTK
jgi:hypothetical protein